MSQHAAWSVLWVDFDPQVGREQAGRRPAIVVASPLAARIGERSGLTTVVPCTSTDRNLPWQPRIELGGRPGVAMCDQIKTIRTRRVAGLHPGTLTADEIDRIKQVLHSLLAI
jgi:mRNA interferase MazF